MLEQTWRAGASVNFRFEKVGKIVGLVLRERSSMLFRVPCMIQAKRLLRLCSAGMFRSGSLLRLWLRTLCIVRGSRCRLVLLSVSLKIVPTLVSRRLVASVVVSAYSSMVLTASYSDSCFRRSFGFSTSCCLGDSLACVWL